MLVYGVVSLQLTPYIEKVTFCSLFQEVAHLDIIHVCSSNIKQKDCLIYSSAKKLGVTDAGFEIEIILKSTCLLQKHAASYMMVSGKRTRISIMEGFKVLICLEIEKEAGSCFYTVTFTILRKSQFSIPRVA